MATANRLHGRRPVTAVALLAAVVLASHSLWAWAAPGKEPGRFAGVREPVHKQATALSAEAKEGERTDEERLAFMDSPLGQVVGVIAKALSSGPLNDGKIWLAKMQAGEYDETAVSAKLDGYINDNKVTMFAFSKCPFCIKAKQELDTMGVNYLAVDLDKMGDEGTQIRAELAKKTSRTSMPNIFIAGEGIGGCNDGPGLMTLKKEGKLTPMLEAAGALR